MKLIKDSLWNMLAIIIPAIIAIPVFSLISKTVGVELFGIYTLSFAIAGYASIFDLGLSRALIREIAMNIGNDTAIVAISNTAFVLNALLSVIAGVAIFVSSPLIVSLMKVSVEHYADVLLGLKILAVSLALFLISNSWLSYFEGLARFKQLSLIKTLGNSLIVIMPYLMLQWSVNFVMLMAGLLVARLVVFLIAYGWLVKNMTPKWQYDTAIAKRLFGFGGWVTVSMVVNPVLVYLDRFVLSYTIGAKNVAFYTAPSELTMRLLSLPSAVGRALFARLSNAPKGNESVIYWLGMASLGAMAVLLALPLFLFAEPVLVLWVGDVYRGEPAKVLQVLLIGFVVNAIAQIPFASLQAKGRAKLTAMLHCAEVVPYLVVLYVLLNAYGLVGVAWAWTLRIVVDTLLMLYFDKKVNGNE